LVNLANIINLVLADILSITYIFNIARNNIYIFIFFVSRIYSYISFASFFYYVTKRNKTTVSMFG
jgi:hypothetical protein